MRLEPITFLKCKYDGLVKRQRTADLVVGDGDWLVVYSTPARHTHLYYGKPYQGYDSAHMIWWLNTKLPLAAHHAFTADGTIEAVAVDACLPATYAAGVVRYVDLDLDIISERGEPAHVEDLEDFEQRRRALAYPPDVVDAAWRGIRIGTELLGARAYPFDGSGTQLLAEILSTRPELQNRAR